MTEGSWAAPRPLQRVISDNDYCGDPDGLVQLAHHLLSPSVDMRFVVGSIVAPYDPSFSPTSADASVAAATRVAELAGRSDVAIVAGSNRALEQRDRPQPSAAVEAIVREALRDDTELPLVVACGGGLTNIASAWLLEPRIAERLTLVWIGGPEHEDLAEPAPGGLAVEYNTSIDLLAAQVVFNDSELAIWQVPRDRYRQMLASRAELLTRMQPAGPLGAHLFEQLGGVADFLGEFGLRGECYPLGDSPLVLLTALLSLFDPAPSSSRSVVRPRPRIDDSGHYVPRGDGPPLRIFTDLDVRLTLEDLYAKLALHARSVR
jgi:inosine-uridine nucleoside N-ribohydrolase